MRKKKGEKIAKTTKKVNNTSYIRVNSVINFSLHRFQGYKKTIIDESIQIRLFRLCRKICKRI